jgi:hypothetical protein
MKMLISILSIPLIFSLTGCVTPPQKLITLEHDVGATTEFELPIEKKDDELLVYILNDATNENKIYFNQNGSERSNLEQGEFTYFKIKKGFNTVQFNDYDSSAMDYHACFNREDDTIFLVLGNVNEEYEGAADFVNKNFRSLNSIALNVQQLTMGGVSSGASNTAFMLSLLTPIPEQYTYFEVPFEIGVSNLNKFKYKEVSFHNSYTKDIRYIDIVSNCNAEIMESNSRKIQEKPREGTSLLTFVFTEKNVDSETGEEKYFTVWGKDGVVAHFNQEQSVFQTELKEGKHYFYLSDQSYYMDRVEVTAEKNKHYMVKIKPSMFYKAVPLNLNRQKEYVFDDGQLIESSSKKVFTNVELVKGNNPVLKKVNTNVLPLLKEQIGDLETGKDTAEIIINDSLGKNFN